MSFKCVCVCGMVYSRGDVCVSMSAPVCRGQYQVSFGHSPSFLLRQDLTLNLELVTYYRPRHDCLVYRLFVRDSKASDPMCLGHAVLGLSAVMVVQLANPRKEGAGL